MLTTEDRELIRAQLKAAFSFLLRRITGEYDPAVRERLAFAGNAVSEDMLLPVIIGIIIMELVVGILMMILHSLIVFSFPLIVDRGLNGFEAVKLSARAVWANRGGVAGLFGVGILVAMVGYLALCVGVYLALPVLLMAMAVAYRKVFPATEPRRFDPPPPDAYQGL